MPCMSWIFANRFGKCATFAQSFLEQVHAGNAAPDATRHWPDRTSARKLQRVTWRETLRQVRLSFAGVSMSRPSDGITVRKQQFKVLPRRASEHHA